MRWNPDHPATHQYATDINWANANAQYLKQLYNEIKALVNILISQAIVNK